MSGAASGASARDCKIVSTTAGVRTAQRCVLTLARRQEELVAPAGLDAVVDLAVAAGLRKRSLGAELVINGAWEEGYVSAL